MQPRWLGARRLTWHEASSLLRGSTRETEPRTVVERALEGRRIPGEHRRAAPAWPGEGVVAERTPGGSKASKRACRPLTGEPSVGGRGTVRAARLTRRGDRPSDREERRPGSASRVCLRAGSSGQRAGARQRNRSWRSRRRCAGGSRKRTRKEARGPRERVRLPGKGKLWRDVPGTRAAWNKAAKRRGPRRTARSKRPRASRELAGTVERGKNPEDGTDGGLATSVPHGRPQGSAWRTRGTRRSCVRGSKNPTRGRPARLPSDSVPFRRGRAGDGASGRRAKLTKLWRGPDPTRVDRGT